MLLGWILGSTFIISLVSLLGGFGLINKLTYKKKFLTFFVSFAAGVMLASAFFDLFPEALELGDAESIFMPAFLGIVLFFFLERFVLWFHHHDDDHHLKPSTILINVGDGIHNFIDGVVIAATFIANPTLGVVTTLAIAAHEIPHELADFSVMIHGGMSRGRALFYNFLSALTALLGSVLGYFFLEKLEGSLSFFLAFTAGMFIYIACSDLIPDLHKEFKQNKNWNQALPFLIGIAMIYLIITFVEGH
jgi:zinc and cadmium transporter